MVLHRAKANRMMSEHLWHLASDNILTRAIEPMVGVSFNKAQRTERIADYAERLLGGEKIRANNCIYWITP